MDSIDANASEIESAVENPSETAPDALAVPTLDVEVATVCVVDGIWQDQPDNVASFGEARLGDFARGRGNLYICLDVSGEVEGRSDIERALVEVIRDTYASSRGSVSFGLSEALRAANAYLYDNNRQVPREQRRMAGVSAVVLRGSDLYICQAGPAVVLVEAAEKLARYPAESDWFTEDAPLIAPQGTASAPLGIRREFASDLAHTSVSVGDVFVLATRGLTQLATTEELAIAFTERSAQEIGAYLEELGQDADLTALVAELVDARTHAISVSDDTHIESIPVPLDALVLPDEDEPELEQPVDAEPEPAPAWDTRAAPANADAEAELNWDADDALPEDAPYVEADSGTSVEPAKIESESEPAPVYASAAAAMPMMRAPAFPAPQPEPLDYEAELERRRAERAARRAAQNAAIQRVVGGIVAAMALVGGAVSGLWHRAFGEVDWAQKSKQTNRTLNLAVGALVSFFLLLVRLVLPGAPAASTKLVPRRATSDPAWLKALAFALPVLLVGLAGARFYQTINSRQAQFEALLAQADTIVKQAEVNPDHAQAFAQLQDARKILNEAAALQDSPKTRALLYRIQDQQNEIDGVAIFRFLPTLAQAGGGATFAQIAASDQDVFLLDRQNRVYQYVVNDVSGDAKPAGTNAVILKPGDKVGDQTIGAVRLIASAPRGQDKPLLVAVTDKSLLAYDLESRQWSAYDIQDADKWGDLRAIDGFNGNIYLLDAQNNQIYKYTATAAGYSPKATPYFPTNAQPLLSKAVDMAIDGDVWILNDNGTVQRYRAGTAIPFELEMLPTPLKNPVAIYTRPEADSIYIADAGNQRIVEFDKNGKFVRQFRAAAEKNEALTNLQDLTVNELKRKIYFVNANAAYLANLAK
jgi:hypothetical protein